MLLKAGKEKNCSQNLLFAMEKILPGRFVKSPADTSRGLRIMLENLHLVCELLCHSSINSHYTVMVVFHSISWSFYCGGYFLNSVGLLLNMLDLIFHFPAPCVII